MPPPGNGGGGGDQGVTVVQPYYKIVKGLPAAIVRSYKEPLWDSELVLAASPNTEFILYSRPLGQQLRDNATSKTYIHTNQVAASTLGTPLSFDVYGFNARLWGSLTSKTVTPGNFDLFYSHAVAEVIFGQDTKFLTIPLEDVPSGVDTEGNGGTDTLHIGLGISDNIYRFDIGGRALHINSTENYGVKISFPSGLAGTTGNLLFRWYMRGIKYKGV
jgi:hypothetical protein